MATGINKRVVLASVVLLATATGNAMAQQGREPLKEGGAAFAQYCGACHDEAKMARRLSRQPRESVRAEALDFLTRHGRSDDRIDAAIVDYLLALPARSTE